MFVALSVAGYGGLVWIAVAVLVAVATKRPLARVTLTVAASVWSADLIAGLLKAATDRPRPFETLAEVDPLLGATVGTAMPSGHASTSFAGAVVLSVLFPRAAGAFLALAAAIAFSRIYVGVHYPSDVLAGAALGAAVGAGVALLALRRPRPTSGVPRRSEEAPRAG